eukprot:scaffold32330_cov20-Prasinocladus_malaysianus.AAC.1
MHEARSGSRLLKRAACRSAISPQSSLWAAGRNSVASDSCTVSWWHSMLVSEHQNDLTNQAAAAIALQGSYQAGSDRCECEKGTHHRITWRV